MVGMKRKAPRKAITKRKAKGNYMKMKKQPKRVFMQRYFIDKYRKDGTVEWDIFSIEVKGATKKGEKIKTKKSMLKKLDSLTR
jgi:hypothetical protein